ncbi:MULTISPECIES: hypothetical protein [unclassified Modestobacter]|uniref:hypothetical protein n=1 Tax=unclassified Modestobacter TaxID=2643866 RepID=UPI0022AB1E8C|nr:MULTISPECIES: hypothetical protein [unclassified Modestobacter]MCZ2824704.1 hypothetical protein [Modestobacter sp. VKM Ac-2981]MCZ2854793.1 hypothetical protein [Modestobacter sp. VKM Ac-2982]
MPSMKDPSPEAIANVTEQNVESRARLLPEEQSVEGDTDPTNEGLDPEVQAAVILAESEERTINADPDDAQGGHRQSAETADLP